MKQAETRMWLFPLVCLMMLLGGVNCFAAEKVIKVGVVGSYTGSDAVWGQNIKAAVQSAFKKINYKLGDYKFELVWVDEVADPAKATNAFSDAVERKKIDVALMDVHSSVSLALMDQVAHYKIPLYFAMGGAADTINKKFLSNPKKYSYFGGKGWPTPSKLAVSYVDCINNAVKNGTYKPASKTVAVYGEDNDWGRSLCAELKRSFQRTGWQVVSEDYVPSSQVDFYPILSKYKQKNVSIVAGTLTAAAGMSALIKQSREIGLKATIIADGLGGNGDWYKLVGNDANGVLDMVPQLSTPAAQAWVKTIQKDYGFVPSATSGGQAYDYANFFIKASRRVLEKYGKLDRDGYYKVLVDEVQTGKLTYSRQEGALLAKQYKYTKESMPDPVVGQEYYFFPVIQYNNGKGNIVYPESMKQVNIKLK